MSNNDAIMSDLLTLFESYPETLSETAEAMADAVDSTIEVYKNATQSISGATDVIWNATNIKDTGFTFTDGNSEITVPKGRYRILCRATIYETGGSSSARSKIVLQDDSGGSYADMPGSQAYAYHPASEYQTLISMVTVEFSSSAKVKAVADKPSGSGSLSLYSDGCTLVVKRL